MPNQKDIARKLGISQTAVSMALRNERSVSPALRKKVQDTAKRMGYHPNAYLTVLMSNIRNGKKLTDRGVIGMLIEAASEKEWHKVDTYRLFHEGAAQRAYELGFHIEPFFLLAPGMSDKKIDRILDARGIKGIILAPPYYGNRSLNLHWDRYAAVGIGLGWDDQDLTCIEHDNLNNYVLAFEELRKLGYKRIGTVLDEAFITGKRHGLKWYTSYLDCMNGIPESERIPVCSAPLTAKDRSAELLAAIRKQLEQWFLKWHPDVVLTLVGEQKQWLEAMGLRIPEDIGLACLALPSNCSYAGVLEKNNVVGAAAVEQVAAQIARNEFGLPMHRKIIMIEGQWISGNTIRIQH